MKKYEYDAVLQETPDNGGAYVVFPWDIRREFGKGRVKVHAVFDGIPYEGSVVNMGLKNPDGSVCYIIGVLKAIRNRLNKHGGDTVHVVIEPAAEPESRAPKPDPDILLFLDGHPKAISFSNRYVFACLSFAKVKPAAMLPEGYIVLTLGLPEPLDSDRVAVLTEPRPGRWTHHIVVSRPDELDEELLSWITAAYDFAAAKR